MSAKNKLTVRKVLQQIFGRDVGNYIITFLDKNYYDMRSFVYAVDTTHMSDSSHCGVFQVVKDCDHLATHINMFIIRLGNNKVLYQDIMDSVKNTSESLMESMIYLSVKHQNHLYGKGMFLMETQDIREIEKHPQYQHALADAGIVCYFYHYDENGSLQEHELKSSKDLIKQVIAFSELVVNKNVKIKKRTKMPFFDWKFIQKGEITCH